MRLLRLPEREVALILLQVARLLRDHVLELRARQAPVLGEPRHPEVDVSVRHVREISRDQLLDERDDLRDRLGRLRLQVRPPQPELVGVLEEPGRRALGQLAARDPELHGLGVHLVVDVRDVVDEGHVVPRLTEPAPEPHRAARRAGSCRRGCADRPSSRRRTSGSAPEAAVARRSPARACRTGAPLDRTQAIEARESASSRGSAASTAHSSGPVGAPVSASRRERRSPPTALQLAEDPPARSLGVEAIRRSLPQLAKRSRVGCASSGSSAWRRASSTSRAYARASTSERAPRSAGTRRRARRGRVRQLLVGHRRDRVGRESPEAGEVEVDVVLRQTELVEVRPDRLGREALVAELADRRVAVALRELLPVLAEHQAVVDHLRQLAADRPSDAAVELEVRAVVRSRG